MHRRDSSLNTSVGVTPGGGEVEDFPTEPVRRSLPVVGTLCCGRPPPATGPRCGKVDEAETECDRGRRGRTGLKSFIVDDEFRRVVEE